MHGRTLGVTGCCLAAAWIAACSAGQGAERDPAPAGAAPAGRVRPGIEVLLADSAHLVRGRRVGILTNQTGVDLAGRSDVDRLRDAGVNLVAIFSPEHGFRGTAAPGEAVKSSVDPGTGLPIFSLYDASRDTLARARADSALRSLEVVLVDLQDAGARYYTYIATIGAVLGVVGGGPTRVVVLDRPNPLGGAVQGNVLEPAHRTSVGFLPVAMRHGMTLGELALMAREDRGYRAALTVVPLEGWRRAAAYDETGLAFVPPSPNLRSVEALFHYPGLCLFEGTALSVGRGTAAPFEQIGAPWLDTAAVLARVRAARLPGVAFEGVRVTPRAPGDGKFADTLLAGIRLRVVDRASYDPTVVAVHLLAAVHERHPDRFGWNERHFDRLAGTSRLREQLRAGRPPAEIVAPWPAERRAFLSTRRPFLLYE